MKVSKFDPWQKQKRFAPQISFVFAMATAMI
jgi:hypothetical protein